MEIVVPPSPYLLWIMLGVDLVVVASVMLKRGLKAPARILTLAVVAAITVVVLIIFHRPLRLQVREDALVDNTYFGQVTTPWTQVKRAFLVADYQSTDWRPVLRVGGNSLPGLKTGWFRLQNGQTARVLIQDSADALILQTEKALYVLAPSRLQELVEAVGRYVNVGREPQP